MSFNLQPTDNSSFWPTTAAPNITHFQAIGYGSGLNQFRISKAGALNASDPMTYDLSRPFTLRQYWHDRHAQYRAEEIDDVLEDAKKVKMYLVVGIVLSGLVAGLVGCLLGWWSARRNLKRTGGFSEQDKAGAFESMRGRGVVS
jgi:asparagine synthetase B (glutamine-hydrolysing)